MMFHQVQIIPVKMVNSGMKMQANVLYAIVAVKHVRNLTVIVSPVTRIFTLVMVTVSLMLKILVDLMDMQVNACLAQKIVKLVAGKHAQHAMMNSLF